MNSQKISVIIPTYNRVQCIQGAIDSVLNQTNSAEELIVVDNGSTNETKSVLATYGDKIKYHLSWLVELAAVQFVVVCERR